MYFLAVLTYPNVEDANRKLQCIYCLLPKENEHVFLIFASTLIFICIITALLFSPYLFEFSHGALLKMDCSINDFLSFYAGGSILKAYFKFISENSSDLGLIDSASNVARELFAYVLRDGSLHYSPLSTDYLFFLLDKIDEIKETAKSTGFECENLIKFRYHIEIEGIII